MSTSLSPQQVFEKSQQLKYAGNLDAYFAFMAEDVVVEDGFTH